MPHKIAGKKNESATGLFPFIMRRRVQEDLLNHGATPTVTVQKGNVEYSTKDTRLEESLNTLRSSVSVYRPFSLLFITSHNIVTTTEIRKASPANSNYPGSSKLEPLH